MSTGRLGGSGLESAWDKKRQAPFRMPAVPQLRTPTPDQGTPAQEALPQWLTSRGEFQQKVQTRIAHNLQVIHAMTLRRPEISLLEADGGWSAVLRLPAVRSDEEWGLELLRQGVAMHPGHFYDFHAGAHLVASLLPREEDFANGLRILEETSAKLRF